MSQALPRSGIFREPIFWLTTSENANGNAERTRVRMVNGRKVTEKLPQVGHDGSCDYENKVRAKGTRYIMVVRHEGHVVAMCLTNAAAHLDASGPYANYMRSKARFLGWYPAGACPCALLAGGELRRDHFVSDEVKKGTPCVGRRANMDDPCPHDLAEREARRKQWNADQTERMAAFKTDAEKLAAEQRQMNGELLRDMAVKVAEILSASKTEAVQAPIAEHAAPSKPEKGAK